MNHAFFASRNRHDSACKLILSVVSVFLGTTQKIDDYMTAIWNRAVDVTKLTAEQMEGTSGMKETAMFSFLTLGGFVYFDAGHCMDNPLHGHIVGVQARPRRPSVALRCAAYNALDDTTVLHNQNYITRTHCI